MSLREVLELEVVIAAISQLLFVVLYAVLAPWWKTRTGKGIFIKAVTLAALLVMYVLPFVIKVYIPYEVQIILWALFILAINIGLTFNLVYKQFIEPGHRPDRIINPKRK